MKFLLRFCWTSCGDFWFLDHLLCPSLSMIFHCSTGIFLPNLTLNYCVGRMCIQRHTFVIWRLTSLPVSLPISPALPYWTNVTSYRLLPPLSFLTYFSQICFFSYYVSYLVYIVTDHHFSHCSSQISYTCDRNHGVRLTWRSWSSITPSPPFSFVGLLLPAIGDSVDFYSNLFLIL